MQASPNVKRLLDTLSGCVAALPRAEESVQPFYDRQPDYARDDCGSWVNSCHDCYEAMVITKALEFTVSWLLWPKDRVENMILN